MLLLLQHNVNVDVATTTTTASDDDDDECNENEIKTFIYCSVPPWLLWYFPRVDFVEVN